MLFGCLMPSNYSLVIEGGDSMLSWNCPAAWHRTPELHSSHEWEVRSSIQMNMSFRDSEKYKPAPVFILCSLYDQ
jgi:hypothetical protein